MNDLKQQSQNVFFLEGFLLYLTHYFPTPMENGWTREMVENVIRYAMKLHAHTKDSLCYFLSDIIPEISFGEVAAFMPDSGLTSYGLEQKEQAKKKYHIIIGNNDSHKFVSVGGHRYYT